MDGGQSRASRSFPLELMKASNGSIPLLRIHTNTFFVLLDVPIELPDGILTVFGIINRVWRPAMRIASFLGSSEQMTNRRELFVATRDGGVGGSWGSRLR